MYRRLAATTVALALLLAGCSGSSGSDDPTETPTASASAEATASAEDIAALESVKVEGDLGAEPTVTYDTWPFTVSANVARVVTEGEGEALEDGQVLAVDYVAVNGADGTTLGTTYGASHESLTLGDANIVGALNDILMDQNVGSRVLLAVPGTDSVTLMAIEVVSATTVPDRAEGEAVAPADGLPTVTLAEDGTPSITPVAGDAPTELVVQPLIKGSGAAVEAGQSVTVHYSGWLWDGTAFDSSWGSSPFTTVIGSGQVIDGWDQGLVGQTVGSQVLLVVPPSLGYGDKDQSAIPANSTLVFVVDILAAS
ncbi:FKBP-type peptidyl-prolyl cis-trans isomerase [Cellulomonas sp. P22]|uniref:FKBP-type peptidyl-prolyl cis-trans isomerase n=1 Tax=Cellulomonas sp. P22 TaxID=3373189 RepID=UPI0037AD8602